jgi:hypothetical protein
MRFVRARLSGRLAVLQVGGDVMRRFITITALSIAWAATANAQTIRFVYLAPAAAAEKAFGAAAVDTDMATGYKAVSVTGAAVVTFRKVAPPRIKHVFEELQPKQPLRVAVDKVMTISGGKVDVTYYLVDDRTGITGEADFSLSAKDGKQHVWPAASVSEKGGGRYAGRIGLGEVFADEIATDGAGGVKALDGTVLHETSHTQWVGAWTKWGAHNGRAITYGADGDHYIKELLGDQNAAIDEGHASFYGYMYNPDERNELIAWFNGTGHRYFVEARSVLAGEPALYKSKARQPGTVNGNNVFKYRWNDVPGFFLLFSESTPSVFYLLFRERVNEDPDQALDMIVNASKGMWLDRKKRHLTYAANRLALQLEDRAATPAGAAMKKAGTLTSSMFPFALLDIVTHFGMTADEYKADYRRNYADRDPKAWTEYWNHREAVRQLVEPHVTAKSIQIEEAVIAVHKYFQQADKILASAKPST